jgi:hypothetical protein
MRLTFVRSELDNSTADRADHEWPDVARFLTAHRRLERKGELGVIFARFVDGPCRRRARTGKCTAACPGNDHRLDENVEAVTALGLDFDDAPADRLGALLQRLSGTRHVYYSTWSSTPEHPKLRIVIALDAEVPAAQFRGFWDAVVDELHIRDIVDTKCRNPGRLFFTPQCPQGATPFAAAVDGVLLPTAPILARVPSQDLTTAPTDDVHDFGPASPALLQHALTRLQAHGAAVAGKGGNAHTRAAWGILVNDLALSDAEARAVFRVWDLQNQPPWGDDAWSGPCRADQAWSSPRGAERTRIEHDGADIFGDTTPGPTYPSVLADAPDHAQAVAIRRYATGLPGLDAKLGGGISTRQATIVMAPPADGKSALAVAISLYVQHTIAVLYASTELETHELRARLAAPRLGVAWREIVDGKIERERVDAALHGLRIHLLGCERLPMGEAALQAIEAETVRLAAHYGVPPMVVIDYLQDLARGTDERGVRGKIGGLATVCRAMSQRLDCVMLVISSVSRTYYGIKRAEELRRAEDATAYLAAAKESGDVDYAAAAVVFLDVVPPEPGTSFRVARLAVAKSRHGETGFVGARFTGATGAWSEAADEVLQASERRAERTKVDTSEQTDARMLAAITQRAAAGEFYTQREWRGDLKPAEMSQHDVNDACERLTRPGAALVRQRMHPVVQRNAPGGGTYLVPRSMAQV